ncbi:MAG: recombinase, partial [Chloroflexi bacterium]
MSVDAVLTIAEAHRRFIDEDLRLSPRTRRTYDYSLRTFLQHIAERHGVDPASAP